MNSYRRIHFWENTRRLQILKKFHSDVVIYFNSPKKTESVQARERITHTVDWAHHIIYGANVNPIIKWRAPSNVGRYTHDVDVIYNVFKLDEFEIPESQVTDLIERAIGVYQSTRRAALFRTINPFWWLFRLLMWFARIPFIVLDEIGFPTTSWEGSLLGKRLKVLLLGVGTVLLGVGTTLGNFLLSWLKVQLGME